jgi:hypothetical protein
MLMQVIQKNIIKNLIKNNLGLNILKFII